MNITSKRAREKHIVSEMIALYCRGNHGTEKGKLCNECARLLTYAHERSDKCPYMEKKTFCSSCKTHCYKPEMRGKIRAVMRYSGPRMMTVHPVLAICHLIESKAEKRRVNRKQGGTP